MILLSIFLDPSFLSAFLGALITGGIALIGVGVSYYSVRKIGEQVTIQKKQCEHSQSPIFRIIYIQPFDKRSTSFVIENSNNFYHRIEGISFSFDDVEIKTDFYGHIEINIIPHKVKRLSKILNTMV